jgi:hypothetical protein
LLDEDVGILGVLVADPETFIASLSPSPSGKGMG